MKRTIEMLEKLSKAFGPSGYEDEVLELIEKFVPKGCQIERTKSGSLIAFLKGVGKERLMFSTHIDEVGLMISKVEGNFARMVPIGGVDPKVLPSQKIKIKTTKGYEYGVVGMLAPHLQKGERKNVDFDSLFLDLSCASNAKVGDPAVVDSNCIAGNDFFAGKALDNRASAVSLLLTLEMLSNTKKHSSVYAVFSSREEVGAIGAMTTAYEVEPSVAIAVDVTFADNDFPNAPDIKLSNGPALSTGPSTFAEIKNVMSKSAEKNGIKYQVEPIPGRTGTDADAIQLSRKGVPVMVVSIPQMYMHTPCEVVNPFDVWETARLLASFASEWSERNVS